MQRVIASYSRTRLLILAALAAVIAVFTYSSAAGPFLPSDVPIARAIQSIRIPIPAAVWITATAERPWCFTLLGLAIVVAWMVSGRRAALVAIPVFFGLWSFGIWLSPHVAQPRPSPELIAVVGHPKGYAFPSIFALVYGASFGYVGLLEVPSQHRGLAIVIRIVAATALLVGGWARVSLGAHWPSDIWAAYLMSLFWIELLMPLTRAADASSVAALRD